MAPKQAELHTITDLEQAKVLADPLRLRILESLCEEARTTKQVADKMGEKAPRLYRHVDALVDEGLLELIEEKPKRGTIERYYKTVAESLAQQPASSVALVSGPVVADRDQPSGPVVRQIEPHTVVVINRAQQT